MKSPRSDADAPLSDPQPTDKLHVHFGAGRLGFGLVLPALENAGSPYVILNRPSAVWTPVVERERQEQQHVGVKVRSIADVSQTFVGRAEISNRVTSRRVGPRSVRVGTRRRHRVVVCIRPTRNAHQDVTASKPAPHHRPPRVHAIDKLLVLRSDARLFLQQRHFCTR